MDGYIFSLEDTNTFNYLDLDILDLTSEDLVRHKLFFVFFVIFTQVMIQLSIGITRRHCQWSCCTRGRGYQYEQRAAARQF